MKRIDDHIGPTPRHVIDDEDSIVFDLAMLPIVIPAAFLAVGALVYFFFPGGR